MNKQSYLIHWFYFFWSEFAYFAGAVEYTDCFSVEG